MVLLSGNRSIPVYFKVRDIFVVCDSKPEFCLYEGSMQAMAKNLYDVYFGENDIGDVVIQMRPGGVSFQCPLKSSKLTTQEIVKLVNERRREEQSNEANGSEVNPLDKANEVNPLDKANEEWNSNLYSVLSSNQPTEDSALSVERIEVKDVDEYEYEYEYEYEWSQERNESPTTPSSRTPIHTHAISPQFELRERLRRRNASSRYSSSLSLVSSNKQTNKQTNRQASRQELQTSANNSHPIPSHPSHRACLKRLNRLRFRQLLELLQRLGLELQRDLHSAHLLQIAACSALRHRLLQILARLRVLLHQHIQLRSLHERRYTGPIHLNRLLQILERLQIVIPRLQLQRR